MHTYTLHYQGHMHTYTRTTKKYSTEKNKTCNNGGNPQNTHNGRRKKLILQGQLLVSTSIVHGTCAPIHTIVIYSSVPNLATFNIAKFFKGTLHIPFLLIFRVALADFLASITESITAVLVGVTSSLFSMCLS